MIKLNSFLLLICSWYCYANEQQIRIVSEEFPPYNYSQNGNAVGTNALLVKQLLAHLNIDTKIEFFPWARTYTTAINEPNTLIFSLARNKNREHLFHWVGQLSTVNACFFSLQQDKLDSVKSLEQLKPYRVAAQRKGHISQQLVNANFKERQNLFSATSIDHAIDMWLSKRVDFIGYTSEVLKYKLSQRGINPETLIITNFCIDSTELYLAFSKDTPMALVTKFKHALEQVKKSNHDDVHSK